MADHDRVPQGRLWNSVVPAGLERTVVYPGPSDQSLGYDQVSLRDTRPDRNESWLFNFNLNLNVNLNATGNLLRLRFTFTFRFPA